MKLNKWLVVTAFVLLCVAVFAVMAQTQKAPPKQAWEYMTVQLFQSSQVDTPTLNRLGSQEWELVGVTSACSVGGTSEGINTTCSYSAYFKRPKTQ